MGDDGRQEEETQFSLAVSRAKRECSTATETTGAEFNSAL